jgi:integrase/recombinase XerD
MKTKSNDNGHRKPRKIPTCLTLDEQGRLLALLYPADTPERLRALTMFRLLINTGLRASELINLKMHDINFKTGQVMVRNGKGSKDRSLWVSDEVLALIQKWREISPASSRVFTTLDGKKPINDRWLRQFMARLGKKAGIEKPLHPHILRHCFACKLLSQTKNLFLVSKALGHVSIATTQIYLHLVDEELETAMKNL